MTYPVAAVSRGRNVLAQAGAVNPYPNILTNLTSWWSFNESSGTREDSHGVNDLTPNGSTASAAGLVGNAADIEAGTSDYLEAANHASLQIAQSDFTLAGWFRWESSATAYGPLVNKGGEFYLGGEFGGAITPYVQISTGGSGVVYGGSALSLATWYYIVVWYDVSDQLAHMQINNGTVYDSAFPDVVGTVNTDTWRFGRHSGGQQFDGLLDEWGLWKGYILSADERTYLYNAGAGRTYAELA